MAIALITGQPGHGKTAYAIERAFKHRDEGRSVYVHGIRDFDYSRAGMHHLDNPRQWQDLPDGSVVVIDECYSVFPNRNPGSMVPSHVQDLATHRHRGFDFILIAQQGLQLDPFIRGLYDEHIHVRQTSVIKGRTKLRRWNKYQSDVNVQSGADVIDWMRPKWVFGYYTSTVLNTTRRTVPMWARWIMLGVVLLVCVFGFLKYRYDSKVDRLRPSVVDVIGSSADTSRLREGAGGDSILSLADYSSRHLPRFPAAPWSAPVYDHRPVTVDPQIYCMSSLAGHGADGWMDSSCTCLTDQGTKYDIGRMDCVRIARYGQPYNPYRSTVVSVRGDGS
ncbi:MAG: zonular occludens toxin domain-containing protein [Xanthomonadaceae bacterium]|jgi:hypothetical protein|nr:zonular occludens toxin domain-containing protein [Xanthomonadaceae bacterium]